MDSTHFLCKKHNSNLISFCSKCVHFICSECTEEHANSSLLVSLQQIQLDASYIYGQYLTTLCATAKSEATDILHSTIEMINNYFDKLAVSIKKYVLANSSFQYPENVITVLGDFLEQNMVNSNEFSAIKHSIQKKLQEIKLFYGAFTDDTKCINKLKMSAAGKLNICKPAQYLDTDVYTYSTHNIQRLEQVLIDHQSIMNRSDFSQKISETIKDRFNDPYKTDIFLMKQQYTRNEFKLLMSIATDCLYKLNSIYLFSFYIGDEGASSIVNLIKVNHDHFRHLTLREIGITFKGLSMLLPYITQCWRLESLDISFNNIGDEGITLISKQWHHWKKLTSLEFIKCDIEEEGANNFCESINQLHQIESINFVPNSISKQGISLLASALLSFKNLANVSIDLNSANSDQICEALQSSPLENVSIKNIDVSKKGLEYLAKALSSDKMLRFITLQSIHLGTEGGIQLHNAFMNSKSIILLRIYCSSLGDEGAYQLGLSLANITTLKYLYLYDNQIGAKGAKGLAISLASLANLSDFNISSNNIGEEGGEILCAALKNCTKVDRIRLSNCQIGNRGAIALGHALKALCCISTLHIDSNNIRHEGFIAICKGLCHLTKLEELKLHGNFIGDCEELGKCLPKSIRRINVGENQIQNEISLLKSLNAGLIITDLSIYDNNLTAERSIELAKELGKMKDIHFLDIGDNPLNTDGGVAICKSLENLTLMVDLRIYNTSIGINGAIALSKAIKNMKILETLVLESNNFAREGAIELGKGLASVLSLIEIRIHRNNIGNEGAFELLKSIACIEQMKSIYLSENGINDEGISQLVPILNKIVRLEELDLSPNSYGVISKQMLEELIKCKNWNLLKKWV